MYNMICATYDEYICMYILIVFFTFRSAVDQDLTSSSTGSFRKVSHKTNFTLYILIEVSGLYYI